MGGENLQELVKKQAKIISGQAKLIERQAEANKKLEARIAGVEAPVRERQEIIARPQKDSRNSSKPLSSDMVKPKPAAPKINGGGKRKAGGQPGHKKHERKPFPQEQADRFVELTLDVCPECGGILNGRAEAVVKRQSNYSVVV